MNEKIIGGIWAERSRDLGKRVEGKRVVGSVESDNLAIPDRVDNALPERKEFTTGLTLVFYPKGHPSEFDCFFVTRAKLDLPAATGYLLTHGSNRTPNGAEYARESCSPDFGLSVGPGSDLSLQDARA